MDKETDAEAAPEPMVDTGDPLARLAPAKSAPQTAQTAQTGVSRTEPVSRRDFLKRASNNAVQTGAALVPGAGIARVVLGASEPDGTRKPSLVERFAQWKKHAAAKTSEEEPK